MTALRSLAIWSLVLIVSAGCRANLAGLPSAGSSSWSPSEASGSAADRLKAAERLMLPANRGVGSSNTITADMPVPRPDTKPCIVTLFERKTFKNFSNKTFGYAPPSSCPGPWAKVVFNFDIRVTKGVQFDRTAILWVDGAVIFFGTTSEPSPNLAPHWHVERDVTDLSALFTQPSQGQVQLWNCYCPSSGYNAYQIGHAYLQFYPADKKYPAPPVPDEVIGLPYSPPLGNVATLPDTPMTFTGTLPMNITRAYVDVFLQSQNKEEQWFMDVPDRVWAESDHALGFSRNTAFRQGEVSVDGKPAGVAPIYPWIYTGGIDPWLWYPIPGVQTLNFVPFRIDITPFAGELSNGSSHTVDVSVFRAFDYFSGAGDLLLYLDPKQTSVSGAVTQDTLTAKPQFVAEDHITFGSGVGLFGAGAPAQGYVKTRSRTDYSISGYVNTSSGKVTTTVSGSGLFDNDQRFDYTSRRYVQLATQSTYFTTSTKTQSQSGTHVNMESFFYPLDVSYPILPDSSGFKLPVKVYQGYVRETRHDHNAPSTVTTNTVKTANTLLLSSSFGLTGERNSKSVQLYTYASKPAHICYGKQIVSVNNVVTTISEPGCTASPPPRPSPH